MFPNRIGFERVRRQRRSSHIERRCRRAVPGAEPAVITPTHLDDGCFPTQGAAPTIAQRPPAKVDHVDLPSLCLHQIGVPGALQLGVGELTG